MRASRKNGSAGRAGRRDPEHFAILGDTFDAAMARQHLTVATTSRKCASCRSWRKVDSAFLIFRQ